MIHAAGDFFYKNEPVKWCFSKMIHWKCYIEFTKVEPVKWYTRSKLGLPERRRNTNTFWTYLVLSVGWHFRHSGLCLQNPKSSFPFEFEKSRWKNGGSTVIYCLPTTNRCSVACLPKNVDCYICSTGALTNATKNIPICVEHFRSWVIKWYTQKWYRKLQSCSSKMVFR